MNKDHFPVNDKTIADVNKANAAAYDSTSEQRENRKMNNSAKYPGNSGTGGGYEHPKATKAISKMNQLQAKKGLRQTDPAEERGIQKKSSGDHVRESSQEKGEQHDAGRSLTSLEQERGTGKAKPRKEDVAKQGAAWKREQERTFAKYGK